MATRTKTELKVFLDSATDSYDKYGNLTDKSGTVFFDRNRRAVYAEGVLITSDVVDVKMTGSKLMVKKVGETTYTELADLAIPNVFVKFTENQGLTIAEQKFARANIGVKDAVDNLESADTIAPLSANQGKVLKGLIDTKVTAETGKGLSTNDYTDEDKNKLGTIARGAQVNKISSFKANTTEVGGSANGVTVSLSGNLVDSTSAASGKVGFNLSMWHDSTNNKIHFFNLPKEQANSSNVDKALFSIDTTDFVKDGILSNAEYNDQTHILTLTFNSDAGKAPIPIDLSDLANVYKASNGITLDGDTFKLSLGDGVTVEGGSLTLSLGNGLSFDTSGKLKVDFESNGVTSINGMGGGAYIINAEGVTVGTGNALHPIFVDNNSSAKKLTIEANPAEMLALFFHENKKNENATSGIRAKGVLIEEAADGNPYSMLMDFTPKVWKFEN